MKTIKIFLASSSELESDRREFEIFINRKNKEYIKQGLFLELLLWEDFIDAMSATRLQDEYNKAVADCDIFVSLFHTKVGKYTEEEFLKALDTFKVKGKPLIYTYFNQAKVEITPQIVSLLNFQQKLSDMGHFYTKYDNIDDLKFKFSEQLIKVLPQLTDINPHSLEYLKEDNGRNSENQNNTNVEQNFYGNVGNAVGNVGRDYNINNSSNNSRETRKINIGTGNYNENIQSNAKVAGAIYEGVIEKQEDVAAQVKKILEQLSAKLPTNTKVEKNTVVNQAFNQIESNPRLKSKVMNALETQGSQAFEEAISHSLAKKLVSALED